MMASRILLVSILLTAVFYIGGFVALGSGFPTVDMSGEEIIAWFTENGIKARIYVWTSAFLSLGLAIFTGLVAWVMPKPHRYIFFSGVIGCLITAQVQAWFWAGLAFHPEGLDPSTARTLFLIPAFWGPLINGSMATMVIAFVALGMAKQPIIPRWLTFLSIVFGLEQLIETVTVFGTSGFIAPGGAMNVYLGGMLGFLWVGGVVRWAMPRLRQQARARPAGLTVERLPVDLLRLKLPFAQHDGDAACNDDRRADIGCDVRDFIP